MSRRRFILSRPASTDIDEILEYILERSGPTRAQHVASRLYDAFQMLCDSPGMGHRREDLTAAPVRFWPVWSYLIVYKADPKPIEIVRVLHGARDVRKLLKASS
jgi:antitoxin ParD1/3/4/toxin ParE1/3/4